MLSLLLPMNGTQLTVFFLNTVFPEEYPLAPSSALC